jgi:ABC-type transport system substrate-binding protein
MLKQRTDRVVLEAHLGYWSPKRFPRLQRIVFDNTLSQKEALELIKTGEGHVDLLAGLSPLETLRVAESPFAKVVKDRKVARTMFGFFNMRKTGTPWRDIRLCQAVNYAINREDLIRYAAKGNGVIVPALLGSQTTGSDHDLAPYSFAPAKTRELLREAGYPDGLTLTLIARKSLSAQATVVGKMLEQAGFIVPLQLLDTDTYHQMTFLSEPDQPPEQQSWDIALQAGVDRSN